MSVEPGARKPSLLHKGETYWFCRPECRETFKADPEKHLNDQAAEPEAVPGSMWICPMDPHVRESVTGPCPDCGMSLEPETPAAEAGSAEAAEWAARLRRAISFGVPVVYLEHMEAPGWIQALFAGPVMFWAGAILLRRGWDGLRVLKPNMFTLISMGTLTAFAYSLYLSLAPEAWTRGLGGALHFETAVWIVALVMAGQWLELRARARSRSSLESLLNLAPKMAVRVGEPDEDILASAIRIGDLLRVRPGTAVPADGVVVEGETAVNEAMLTGEAMPAFKEPGSRVSAGTVNMEGGFVFRAERVGRDTAAARVARLVAEAQRSRAPVQNLADKISAHFVPGVVVTAAAAFLCWWLFAGDLARAVDAAVGVLVIACPCALGLAVPMSVTVAVGRGARSGILVRDAAALETLARADVVVLDKTGTLTEGRPALKSLAAPPAVEPDWALRYAAAVEASSEHPLARAVTEAARARGISWPSAENVRARPGRGLSGRVEGREVLVGSRSFLLEAGADLEGLPDGRASYVCVDGRGALALSFSDPLRQGVRDAVREFKARGMRVVLATGAGREEAEACGRDLGLTEIRSQMLPEQKLELVRELQADGRVVVMVGDGINDAPALAQADVGVAVGSGTDAALESAAVALLEGGAEKLPKALLLGRLAARNARQNLFFAFVYNFIGIPLAAGAFYPAFGLVLPPAFAGAAMSLSSLCVIVNALRLQAANLSSPGKNDKVRNMQVLLAAALLLPFSACRKAEESLVARVGKAVITESHFREKLEEVSPDYQGYVMTPYGRRQFLDVLVREEMILQAAQADGVAASPEFKDRMRKLRHEEERKLSEARDYLLTRMWMDKLREEGVLRISDDEIRDFHRKNPRETHVRHILLPTAEEADAIVKRIRSGESFAKLAKEHSLDADTAVQGGEMQPAMYGEIIPELEEVYRMRVGEAAGPIRSKFGYHVVMKESEKVVPLEEVRERLLAVLEKKKLDEHLRSLQARYPVEVLDAQFR